MLNSNSELSHCWNTRFDCQISKILKIRLGDFFPISSYIIFRSVRRLQGLPLLSVGEGHACNTVCIAVPDEEHSIAVLTDGVISISILVTTDRNIPGYSNGRVRKQFRQFVIPRQYAIPE
jgi:hypothetical protein